MEDAKATFKIVLFFVLLGIAIIVPFVVFQDLNYDDEDFPEFQNINISKSDLEDEFEYDKIRTQLENDIYFRKLTTMIEYDSEHFTSEHLDKLVWHFIFNYVSVFPLSVKGNKALLFSYEFFLTIDFNSWFILAPVRHTKYDFGFC